MDLLTACLAMKGKNKRKRTGSVSKTILGITNNALVAYAAAQSAYVNCTQCGRGVATLTSLNCHSSVTPATQNTAPALHVSCSCQPWLHLTLCCIRERGDGFKSAAAMKYKWSSNGQSNNCK